MDDKIAKQLLLNHTCIKCKYMDYYYPAGNKKERIYMCRNKIIKIKEISELTKQFIDLDKRGTCERWELME